jgi:prevent-host-death family protein
MKTQERTISASEFKAKCLKILDELDARGVLITKRGRAVARLIPAGAVDNSKLIGSMKGKIKVRGNIFSTGRKWDAQSRHPRLDLAYHR